MSVILTKYFTNGCGHCKDFEPIWKQIKDKFGEAANEVDCGIDGKVCQDNRIQGIPSLRYTLKDDETKFSVEHTGDRTLEAVSNTMDKLSTMHVHSCSCKKNKIEQTDLMSKVTSVLGKLF